MEATDLARLIDGLCRSLKLPYYVTGSVASMQYGESRSTIDLDVVIELPSWNVREFCAAFPPPDWYIESEAVLHAVQTNTPFNVINSTEGLKIDVMPVREGQYEECRLARARRLDLPGGGSAMFAAPEDVILKKLEFFREGASDKHLRDIASMLKVSGPEIDLDYIASWAPRLGVTEEWGMMKKRLGMA